MSIGANLTTPPANGMYVQGNIGVGVTSPTAKLHVNGNIVATDGYIRVGSISTTCTSSIAGALRYNQNTIEFCDGSTWIALYIAPAKITGACGSAATNQTVKPTSNLCLAGTA